MKEIMIKLNLVAFSVKPLVKFITLNQYNPRSHAALAATIPGFEKFMISSQRRGLTYAVFKGKKISE
jgi:predicted phage tail protein